MPYVALQEAHTMLFLLTSHALVLCAALVSAYLGSKPTDQRLGIELLPTRAHSPAAWRKCRQLVNTTVPPFTLFLQNGKIFCIHRWHIAPWRLMNLCATWIVLAKLLTLPTTRNIKAATTLRRDENQKQDFAKPFAARVSRVFGPVSRFLTAQILLHMCHVSRASRPWLAVGILRVLCNGMCTAQRFHIEEEEQRC